MKKEEEKNDDVEELLLCVYLETEGWEKIYDYTTHSHHCYSKQNMFAPDFR